MLFNAVLAVLGYTSLYDAGYRGRHWWRREGVLSAIAMSFAGATWIILSVVCLYLPFTEPGWADKLFLVWLVMVWAGTLVGLTGLHSHLATRYKKVGWTGFLMAFIGIASVPAIYVIETVLMSEVSAFALVGQVLAFALVGGVLIVPVGFVFLGVAVLRSRVLPRWCGVALMLAIPASCISGIAAELTLFNQATDEGILFFVVFSLLFGLFWLTLGY